MIIHLKIHEQDCMLLFVSFQKKKKVSVKIGKIKAINVTIQFSSAFQSAGVQNMILQSANFLPSTHVSIIIKN